METVNFLAQLWGFSLVIVCFALLLKPKHLKNIFVAAENETALLFLGFFNVMLGVASLLVYNTFGQGWQTLVTLLSWVVLLKGVVYLVSPEMAVKWMRKWQTEYMHRAPVVLVVGVILGCVLIYFGQMV